MRLLAVGLSLAWLCPLVVAADNTTVLPDPTATAAPIRAAGQPAPTPAPAPPPPASTLKDPTLMNQNFREALERTTQNLITAPSLSFGNSHEPKAPVLPKIALLANVWNGQQNANAALLRVGDKSELVYVGDTITTLENDQLLEIQVMDIQKNYVKVQVLPAHEILILR